MTEVVAGLDGAEREHVQALRSAGRFFWIDVALAATSPADLRDALGIPEHALETLVDFAEDRPSAYRFQSDGRNAIFGASCYVESARLQDEGPDRLRPVDVRVLVSGDYVLTVHREPVSLPELLAPSIADGGSEQYAVYAVLDAMLASSFDALNEVEGTLDSLAVTSSDLRSSPIRMATLRTTSAQLSAMRRRAAPERTRFERLGVEITRIEGLGADKERYFERIGEQVNHLVDGIDAAVAAMATLIDLRLNETTYWLTLVATIFLPLTFITGFFGMNFAWMLGEIDTELAFLLLGVGTPVLGVALIWRFVVRGSPAQPERDSRDAA